MHARGWETHIVFLKKKYEIKSLFISYCDSNLLNIPYTLTNVSLILTYPFDVNFYNEFRNTLWHFLGNLSKNTSFYDIFEIADI